MAGKPPSFQAMKPPPGYVAGLGRGATGFTTRSDIGPGAPTPPMGAQATLGDAASGSRAAMARGFGRGRGAPGSVPAVDDEPEHPPAQFDEFQGGDAGIFATRKAEYDEDDREADEIWASVDAHMDSRRRDEREARLKAQLEKYREENPKITEQFADAKRKLKDVTYEEWDAIPDIGDYGVKKKKGGREFVPATDTLLQRALAERKKEAYVADDDDGGGHETGAEESLRKRDDLTAVGEGRGAVLGLKLDSMGDSVAGQTVVDPSGYLTSLNSLKVSSTAEISDIKKARLLLKSVLSTNPKHAPGWIAAARLEELAGKISAARAFAQRGCDACPSNGDVWFEAARLSPPEEARAVLARGVVTLPRNVDLWIAAAQLEDSDERKRRVLRKALEKNPTSVRLWKAAVDLSPEDEAKILLGRATECCPQHVDLWLALARLETKENARVVLNRARRTLPAEPLIWIAAARLEEANLERGAGAGAGAEGGGGAPATLAGATDRVSASGVKTVRAIVERAVRSFAEKGVSIDREFWLKEAEACERSGSPLTCAAIVRATVGVGVDDEDKKRTWKADAAECVARGSLVTARSVYEVATERFPGKKSFWILFAELEKTRGDFESADAVLRRAVGFCPRAVVLWLTAAKELWRRGDVAGARNVLEEAFAANPESEDIWLAAFKLEFESGQVDRARALLRKAREKASAEAAGERVFLKSAIVEREAGDSELERKLLLEGLTHHPTSWKLWCALGQLERRVGAADSAREAYAKGARRCPGAPVIWIEAAALETSVGAHEKARALLEQGRIRNAASSSANVASGFSDAERFRAREALWIASFRRERGEAFCFSAPFYTEHVEKIGKGRVGSSAKPFGDETSDSVTGSFDREASARAAESVMARALRECPESGALWAERVRSASRAQRKSRSVDALKRCGDDARVVAAVASLFWLDRKLEKARSWFRRAVALDPSNGDHWARYYAFEKNHPSSGNAAQEVSEKCVDANPNKGEFWCAVRKHPERWHDGLAEILKRVAALVPGGEGG